MPRLTAPRVLPALLLTAAVTHGAPAVAQPRPVTVKLASVSQWVLLQHGAGREAPVLRAALDGGVVDGVVFAWQRGQLQREALVPKPIRVLAGPDAEALGGRGEFALGAIRPPGGREAWTEVEVVPRSGGPDDILILEIGGELSTVHQVLAVLLVGAPDGSLHRVPLARRALFPAPGVPILAVRFGLPVRPPSGVSFHAVDGLGFLVARSRIDVIVDGDTTTHGPADRATTNVGDWREGDRVLVRASLGALRAGTAPLVLGWKDRTDKPDPEGRPVPPFGLRRLR